MVVPILLLIVSYFSLWLATAIYLEKSGVFNRNDAVFFGVIWPFVWVFALAVVIPFRIVFWIVDIVNGEET